MSHRIKLSCLSKMHKIGLELRKSLAEKHEGMVKLAKERGFYRTMTNAIKGIVIIGDYVGEYCRHREIRDVALIV